jgi:hypothetical protein
MKESHPGAGSFTPNHPDQKRNTPRHKIIKTFSTKNKERILKASKEKKKSHI